MSSPNSEGDGAIILSSNPCIICGNFSCLDIIPLTVSDKNPMSKLNLSSVIS